MCIYSCKFKYYHRNDTEKYEDLIFNRLPSLMPEIPLTDIHCSKLNSAILSINIDQINSTKQTNKYITKRVLSIASNMRQLEPNNILMFQKLEAFRAI